jgi:hypothetical protein
MSAYTFRADYPFGIARTRTPLVRVLYEPTIFFFSLLRQYVRVLFIIFLFY